MEFTLIRAIFLVLPVGLLGDLASQESFYILVMKGVAANVIEPKSIFFASFIDMVLTVNIKSKLFIHRYFAI